MQSDSYFGDFLRFGSALVIMAFFAIAVWAHFHIAILHRPANDLPPIITSVFRFVGWIYDPRGTAEGLLSRFVSNGTSALTAGLLSMAGVKYLTFLLQIPAKKSLESLKHDLTVELAKRELFVSREDMENVLSGIEFVAGHRPSENELTKAHSIAGKHFADLARAFHYSSRSNFSFRRNLKLTELAGWISGAAFSLSFFLALVLTK